MNTQRIPRSKTPAERLHQALSAPNASDRLQAALSAGTRPMRDFVEILIARCAVEPDFYVRDMLTWSLTRHPAQLTVPRLFEEIRSGKPQATSQALHTLSKVGAPLGWAAITTELLQDTDDDVARSAWRAAVALVPKGEEPELAASLASQLGRGNSEVHRSLSRALAALGEAALAILTEPAAHEEVAIRTHAIATQRLVHDPDEGFDAAIFEAQRIIALAAEPQSGSSNADR